MKAKLSGSEKQIRSRIIIDAVRGDINVHSMSRTLQEKCGATDVRIDASSERNTAQLNIGCILISDVHLAGSFAIDDEKRPRVISLDFPPLPSDGSRNSKLLEHGTLNRTFLMLALTSFGARCLPCFRDRLSSGP